jgi:hypothetical protein
MPGPTIDIVVAAIRRSTLVVVLLVLPSLSAKAQYGSDFHRVTVTVAEINQLRVNGGAVSITINGAGVPAGQDQMTATNQSTSLAWGTNGGSRKITAATNRAAPKFSLNLLAVNPTAGTAAPEVTLSTLASDLVLNVGRSLGSCQLRYTGVALASQGTGTDSHTITFTIQTQ